MQKSSHLERTNLSDAAESAIRLMIVEGKFKSGERLNEVHLALKLGVSRTPLREALNRLVSEGALIARPNFGYIVKPLTFKEFEQIYAIRPILDPAALRLAGLPSSDQITRLEKLNRKLLLARSPEAAIVMDDEWHMILLEHCSNSVLIELIQSVTLRTRRYELALFRETNAITRANDDHERILAGLRSSNIEEACVALEENMRTGYAPIVAWLQERERIATSENLK